MLLHFWGYGMMSVCHQIPFQNLPGTRTVCPPRSLYQLSQSTGQTGSKGPLRSYNRIPEVQMCWAGVFSTLCWDVSLPPVSIQEQVISLRMKCNISSITATAATASFIKHRKNKTITACKKLCVCVRQCHTLVFFFNFFDLNVQWKICLLQLGFPNFFCLAI